MEKYERMLIRMRDQFTDMSHGIHENENIRDSVVLMADLCDILAEILSSKQKENSLKDGGKEDES